MSQEGILKALSEALAIWAFCHPRKVAELEQLLQSKWGLKSFKEGATALNRQQLEDAQAALGRDAAGRPFLSLVEQRSGDLVSIPPGWPHMVLNLQVGGSCTGTVHQERQAHL